ncbi:hypothetical protein [Streptomyces sp. NPDC002602]|uniref:hypothetical protein n=1 Tax=Streptomyces sp. NPDC002602 TaxID=3364654 RepID=UPI00368D549C
MDPISVGLLAALAGGVGGELGRQAWAGLSALVRSPFGSSAAQAVEVSSGEPELTSLSEEPSDQSRAQALSTALAVRAAVDPDFRASLAAWQKQAALVGGGDGAVANSVIGGTHHGPILQGRDFTGLTVTSTPPPPPTVPGTPGGSEPGPSR